MSAHAVCVAATDSTGLPNFYSNFPLRLDGGVAVRAPGGDGLAECDTDIWSTYWPGSSDDSLCPLKGYDALAGTSMSTPFVSGIAAMLRGAGLSNQQVLDCLRKTSSNGGSYDPVWGYGIVSAEGAIAGCTQLAATTGNPFAATDTTGQSDPATPATDPNAQQTQTDTGTGQTPQSQQSDTTPPRIRMTIPKSASAHVARAGYITVRVRVSENARLWLQIRNGRETQAVSRGAIVLATALTSLTGGQTKQLHLKLTKAGKKVIRLH